MTHDWYVKLDQEWKFEFEIEFEKEFLKNDSKATRVNPSEPKKEWLLLDKFVENEIKLLPSFRWIFCFWWCAWFFVKMDISWENREIIFKIEK